MVTVLTIISPNEEETLRQCPEITEAPNSVIVNYKKDESSTNYEQVRTQISDAIKSQKDVFIYGDTWTRMDRSHLLSFLRIHTKDIKSVTLVAPYEEKMLTNKELLSKTKVLQLPLLSERFSSTEIRHVIPKQEDDLLSDLIKKASVFEMNQPGKDHYLADHMYRTAWYASDDFGPGESAESIAGMYHDYGKLFAKTAEYGGELHYLCNRALSTYIFLSLMPTLQERYDKDRDILEKAAKLINYLPAAKFHCAKPSDETIKRRFSPDGLFESLLTVHEANLQGPIQVMTK